MKNQKLSKILSVTGKTVLYVLLAIWALIVLFPFYWMILTSFKPNPSIKRFDLIFVHSFKDMTNDLIRKILGIVAVG